MKIKYFSTDEHVFDSEQECLLYESMLTKTINDLTAKPKFVKIDNTVWYKLEDVADLYLFDKNVLGGKKTLITLFKKFKDSDKFPVYMVESGEYTVGMLADQYEKQKQEYQKQIEELDKKLEDLRYIEYYISEEESKGTFTEEEPVEKPVETDNEVVNVEDLPQTK